MPTLSSPDERIPDDLGVHQVHELDDGRGRLIGWCFWERHGVRVEVRGMIWAESITLPEPPIRRPRRWWRNR